ncbi:MAG: pirin family protein [SAR324 cluster bacterium]|nr:pirin family protein [SAR324 cluster bacterium]MBL7034454.1 pirin family protein [SAR324 cluster bacterium]
MFTIRKSEERGHVQYSWLDTRHSFSFGSYYDAGFMGFRNLRVINEDKITASRGFPTHGHQDMEIITYMISGELEHKDSMGNHDVIRPGEIQHMSAGTGIQHSEYNASDLKEAHLLQIWIEPLKNGIKPKYSQKLVRDVIESGKLVLMAAPEGKGGTLTMHADALLYMGILEEKQKIEHQLESYQHAWLQMVRGELLLDSCVLQAGDGLAISEENALKLSAIKSSEFLLFELS